jgi:hypothetical protein
MERQCPCHLCFLSHNFSLRLGLFSLLLWQQHGRRIPGVLSEPLWNSGSRTF